MEVRCRLLGFAAAIGWVLSIACLPALADTASEYGLATDRIIVRLKGGNPARSYDAAQRSAIAARMSAETGHAMTPLRVMGDGAQVMSLPRRMSRREIEAIALRLPRDADVLEVLPDRVFFPALSPTDPLFASQWALSAVSGINAPAAWDITTGASNLVIGIVDTGKLPHEELASRWIGGYDFVMDTNRSNDGDARDGDATDPGDWVTPAEAAGGPLAGCPTTNSRWHGTVMAGAIGAAANNGVGIAGVNWSSKLLPVRVVGKCGAYESDIADGIRWAAGISVPGVPSNANVADVLNVSLAASGVCSVALQSAINEVYNTGVPMVVAAGNNTLDASGFSPGNCANVITVGAVDRNGGKPAYSNFGTAVALSSPGGIGAIVSGTPQDNWVIGPSNAGTTTASGVNSFYASVNGTSIATAIVTGISSLALSVNPSLPPFALREILRNTARAFPTNTTALGSQTDCTTVLCGTGIANAPLAVQAAGQWGHATPVATGGFQFAAVLRSGGTVVTWGRADRGELGTGSTTDTDTPAVVGSLSAIVSLSTGVSADHRLAVRADGTLWAWGLNDYGQLGDGSQTMRTAPVRVPGLPFITRAAAGWILSHALDSEGRLWRWGYNPNGPLDITPVLVPDLTNVVDIAAEEYTLYALRSDGTVWELWGSTNQVPGLPIVVAIAAGRGHLLALAPDGTVWAYGAGWAGVLGNGTSGGAQWVAQPVQGISGVVAVAAGQYTSYALKADGTVWAWGANGAGQVGDGTQITRLFPVRVQRLSGVLRIGASSDTGFAIKPDGSVVQWGMGGTLTSFSSTAYFYPIPVVGVGGTGTLDVGVTDPLAFAPQTDVAPSTVRASNAIVITGIANGAAISASGGQYSIGCTWAPATPETINNNETVCVRQTASATCGTTTTVTLSIAGLAPKSFSVTTVECDATPDPFLFTPQGGVALNSVVTSNAVTIKGITTPAAISITGGTYSIGCSAAYTASAGTIGNNQAVCVRQTASSSNDTLTSAVLTVGGVSAPFDVMTVVGGSFSAPRMISGLRRGAHALRSDGMVLAWGIGEILGTGAAAGSFQSTPVLVPALSGIVRLSSGGHAFQQLAVRSDGTVWAWGFNDSGQLGDGTTSYRGLPARVQGVTSVTRVAHAAFHSVALRSDGTVWAWGTNSCGQLGVEGMPYRLVPGAVPNVSNVVEIAAGADSTFVLKADGSVWYWGCWAGATPVALPGLTQVTAISAALDHLLALKSDGTVWAWGGNTHGQLGNGTTTASTTSAIQVPGLASVTSIAAGSYFSLARKSDGTAWAWGRNDENQLGDGTLITRLAPVQVSGITGVLSVAAGALNGYAIKPDGSAWSWGSLNGLGITTDNNGAASPVQIWGIGGSGFLNLGAADPTSFAAQTDVPVSSERTSNTITVTGISNNAFVSASGGTVSVGCNGVFVAFTIMNNGDTVCVRQTSSASCGTTTTMTLAITGIAAKTFSVTTIVCDTTPDPMAFLPQAGVATGATVTSWPMTVSGLNTPTAISVSGGLYSIGCTATFTSSAGTIANGSSVCVRQTASASTNTLTTATLTIGTRSFPFDVVTQPGAFTTTPRLSGGWNYAHALRSDGSVFAWGHSSGLGAGDPHSGTDNLAVPVNLPALGGITRLSSGPYSLFFGLAVRSDGTVWSWGDNRMGQLGYETYFHYLSYPARVPGITSATRVARGYTHSLALKSDGTVWAWGENSSGQLGDGTTAGPRVMPGAVPSFSGVSEIAATEQGSFALKSDGSVWGWGSSIGSLPVALAGFAGITAIAGGGSHLLALKSDGTVWAWGAGIANGTPQWANSAVQVAGLSGVIAVAAGRSHSLALKSDGTVWAWGSNSDGQLGDGTTVQRHVPMPVVGLSGVSGIEGGYITSYAFKSNGSVWAWGSGNFGSLGNNVTGGFVPLPVPVQGLQGNGFLGLVTANTVPAPFAFSAAAGVPLSTQVSSNGITVAGLGTGTASPIAVSGGEYSVNGGAFTSSAGTVMNGNTVVVRLLSSGAYSTTTSAILTIGGGTGLSSQFFVRTRPDPSFARVVPHVAAGDSHTLMLASDGTVYASGYNGNGQLGNGTTLGLSAMRPVAGLAGVVSIAAGAFHSVALRSDNTIAAWGSNSAGQLGHGSTNGAEVYPVALPGIGNVNAIAAGRYHTLAARQDGTAWAWGLNAEGQVGDGSTAAARSSPVQVQGITGVVAVAAGGRHSLALIAGGTVVAWGANESGQLGDGTATQRNSPVTVAGLTNVVAIAAGDAHSLAIRADGSVVAWGFNAFGQLGDGTASSRSTPVPVASLGTGVGLIAAGANHSLAVKAGGALYTWGNNANSQLGNGANENSSSPVPLSAPAAVTSISAGARHSAAIDSGRKLYLWGDNFFGQVGNRSGNYSPHSASLNVLRGDSTISEATSGSGSTVGTGSNSGSSVLEIDGQATSFDFGSIAPFTARSIPGKYRNQSPDTNIEGISLTVNGASFGLSSNSCQSTLGPGEECTFNLDFTPAGSSSYAGELVVTSNVVGSPERRSLSGTGTGSAAIAFAKAGLDFPPQLVGNSSLASLTLTNTGNAMLNVSSIDSSLGDFAATHTCTNIAPGAGCAISATFIPAGVGTRVAYLTIGSTALGTPHTLTVSGTGISTTAPSAYALGVTRVGSGGGTVASTSPANPVIDCGSTCSANFPSGTQVTLAAVPSGGSTFVGWSGGGCSGTGACVVTMSAPVSVTATFDAAPLSLVGVQSRKTHANGNFDVAIDPAIAVNAAVSVEPRAVGTGHKVVFQFGAPVTAVGSVSMTGVTGFPVGSVSSSISGNNVEVAVGGIGDSSRVTISLSNVNGGANVSAALGFLLADVNGSRSVAADDVAAIKTFSGAQASAANARHDLDLSGAITASDILITKGRVGQTMP